MLLGLIPKEERFFDLLEQGAQNALSAANEFKLLMNNWKTDSPSFQKIRDIESEGDLVTHEVIDKLNRTFITPIDREDIHTLAGEIDDICDILQALSDRMQLYDLGTVMPPMMVQMADLLYENASHVLAAIKEIHNFRKTSRIRDHSIVIKRIENQADDLLKHALADLFKNNADPMYVIKWKELFEGIEFAHDKCSMIANTLEGIVVKNA